MSEVALWPKWALKSWTVAVGVAVVLLAVLEPLQQVLTVVPLPEAWRWVLGVVGVLIVALRAVTTAPVWFVRAPTSGAPGRGVQPVPGDDSLLAPGQPIEGDPLDRPDCDDGETAGVVLDEEAEPLILNADGTLPAGYRIEGDDEDEAAVPVEESADAK